MRLFPLLIVYCSIEAFGREVWLCSSQASQIQGSSVLACGVGEGNSESIARRNAFLSAKEEFSGLCDANSECALHRHSVTPGRTTCEGERDHWKCYRLVTYTITNDPSVARIDSKQVVPQYGRLSNFELMEMSYRKNLIRQLR